MTKDAGDRNVNVGSVNDSVITAGDENVINVTYIYQYDEKLAHASSESLANNPYVGIRAFGQKDAGIYFGRNDQIQRTIEKFKSIFLQKNGLRILPILGPSGCGKSSLVMAGFIPALERQSILGSDIHVMMLSPGSHPVESLSFVLEKAAAEKGISAEYTERFEAEIRARHESGKNDGFRRLIKKHFNVNSSQYSPILIVVDQFEEVYSQCRDDVRPSKAEKERKIFIETLLNAASDSDRLISVILTLRSDFIGEAQKNEMLNSVISSDQSLIVPTMNQKSLREAIILPSRQAGYEFDETFAQVVIDDVKGRDGALPLMQFALEQVWKEMEVDRKTNKQRTAGDIYAEIGEAGGALAKRVQLIYKALGTEEKQAIARRVFLRLVRLDGEKITRRRIALKTLATAKESITKVRDVINDFASPEARVITLLYEQHDESDFDVIVEVTHEALFEHWDELKKWVAESKDDFRFKERLEDASVYWDAQGRPSGLLWRSPDLDLMGQYVKGEKKEECSEISLAFFKASNLADKKSLWLQRLGLAALVLGLITITVMFHSSERRRMDLYASRGLEQADTDSVQSVMNQLAAIGLGRSLFMKFPRFWRKDFFPETALERAVRNLEASHVAGHENIVFDTAMSKDGQTIVSAGSRGIVRLWNADGTPIGQPLQGQSGLVNAVDISEDGKTIVSSSLSGRVVLWNRDGSLIGGPFRSPEGASGDVAISSDGQMVVSGGGNQVLLRDQEGQLVTSPLFGHTNQVTAVAISADGKTIVSGSQDGTVRLWDAQGNSVGEPFRGHSNTILSIAVSADGQVLASSAADDTLQIWNRAGKTLSEPIDDHTDSIESVAISADGKIIVSGDADGLIRTWDTSGNEIDLPLNGQVQSNGDVTKFSGITREGEPPVRDESDEINVWVSRDNELALSLQTYSKSINAVSISADGQTIVSGSSDRTVKIWKREERFSKRLLEGHLGEIFSVSVSADGRFVTSVGFDGLRIWDLKEEYPTIAIPNGDYSIGTVAISANGQVIVGGGEGGFIGLWQRNGEILGEPIKAHSNYVAAVAISDDGQTIATGGQDGSVKLWDRNGTAIRTLSEAKTDDSESFLKATSSLAMSTDGKLIVSSSFDSNVAEIFNFRGDKLEKFGFENPARILSLSVANDGTILSGGSDDQMLFWNDRGDSSEAPIDVKSRTFGGAVSAAISSDSNTIASMFDGSIQLWTRQGERIGGPLNAHDSSVRTVAISADGQVIVSGGSDGFDDDSSVRVWDRSISEGWLSSACNRIRSYLVVASEIDSTAKEAYKTCESHVWEDL